MALVSHRLTAVRVYVKTQNPAVATGDVRGALGGWRDGNFLGVVYPENGPIVARPDGGSRVNVDDSLCFYVPTNWTGNGELTLKAMVYRTSPNTPEDFEPDADNNFVQRQVSFSPAETLKARLIPVHLHVNSNVNNPEVTYRLQDHQDDAISILLNLFRVFPISQFQWDAGLEFEILPLFGGDPAPISATVYPIDHWYDQEWDLSLSDDRSEVNSQIAIWKILFSDDYEGWHWWGMIDPTVSMGNYTGWATSGAAHGKMDTATSVPWYVKGGNNVSHELGHNRGLNHDLCAGNEGPPSGTIDEDYPYPFPDCSIAAVDPEGYYGFDVYWGLWANNVSGPTAMSNDPAASSPNQTFPFMGYSSPKWADPYNYCKLLDSLGVPCSVAALNTSAALIPARSCWLQPRRRTGTSGATTPPKSTRRFP